MEYHNSFNVVTRSGNFASFTVYSSNGLRDSAKLISLDQDLVEKDLDMVPFWNHSTEAISQSLPIPIDIIDLENGCLSGKNSKY